MATLGNSAVGEGSEGLEGGDIRLTRLQMPAAGTITAIENYIATYGGATNYYALIYRGDSSGPTTLAYSSGLITGAAANAVASHTLSSSISASNGEYLWAGALCITGGSSYTFSVGNANAIKSTSGVVEDPLTGESIDTDWRYSVALIYSTGPVTSIDSLDTPIRPGKVLNITTTGLGTLTTATTIGGKAIEAANATDGDGTITAANFVNGETYPAMGSVTVVASDGTDTASLGQTLSTLDNYATVTIATPVDESAFSLFNAWPEGDPPQDGEVIHYPDDGTGVVNSDLSLTDFATGTHTFWVRRYDGVMYSFTAEITESGVSPGGISILSPILNNILTPVVTDA